MVSQEIAHRGLSDKDVYRSSFGVERFQDVQFVGPPCQVLPEEESLLPISVCSSSMFDMRT